MTAVPDLWRVIEDALTRDQPIPPEAKRYLLDVARSLVTVLRCRNGPFVGSYAYSAEEITRWLPRIMGLSGREIREYRDHLDDSRINDLFDRRGAAKAENFAQDLGDFLGLSARQVYRRRGKVKRRS
jgi:hypothetical protein